MNTHDDTVRTMWIPLRGVNILIPNMAVAEITHYRIPEPHDGLPDWILGTISWRGCSIPIISFEALCGMPVPVVSASSKITVLNSVLPGSQMPFYGLVSGDIPRLVRVDRTMINDALEADEEDHAHGMLCRVLVQGQEAIIPDPAQLQSLLGKYWGKAA